MLDLDGLLADLFGAISTRFFNKPYNELTVEEKNQAKKIWYDREHFVDNFGNVEEFFANLEPFGKNGELTNAIINTVVEIAGGYNICSHPASMDSKASEAGKRIWIHKHLNPLPDEMYFPQSKAIYAMNKETGKPNVLIDDFPPYINAWRSAGGVAIEMRTDNFQTVDQIKEFLTKELNAAKDQIEGQVKESFNIQVENILKTYN
jgi:hypothetical protein